MPSRYNTEAVLADCERVGRVWTDNPTFTLGEVTLAGFQGGLAELRQKRDQLEALRMQMAALSKEIKQKSADLAAIQTRALTGFRAVYGPNSSQYKQAGGTLQSERRRTARKGSKAPGGSGK